MTKSELLNFLVVELLSFRVVELLSFECGQLILKKGHWSSEYSFIFWGWERMIIT